MCACVCVCVSGCLTVCANDYLNVLCLSFVNCVQSKNSSQTKWWWLNCDAWCCCCWWCCINILTNARLLSLSSSPYTRTLTVCSSLLDHAFVCTCVWWAAANRERRRTIKREQNTWRCAHESPRLWHRVQSSRAYSNWLWKAKAKSLADWLLVYVYCTLFEHASVCLFVCVSDCGALAVFQGLKQAICRWNDCMWLCLYVYRLRFTTRIQPHVLVCLSTSHRIQCIQYLSITIVYSWICVFMAWNGRLHRNSHRSSYAIKTSPIHRHDFPVRSLNTLSIVFFFLQTKCQPISMKNTYMFECFPQLL